MIAKNADQTYQQAVAARDLAARKPLAIAPSIEPLSRWSPQT